MNAKVWASDGTSLDMTVRSVLRRIAPFLDRHPQPVATHDRLMEESERRLESAAHSGVPIEELVATRLFDSPQDFRRWEDEHALLMRRVAAEQRRTEQKLVLLSASLGLVHRKALFEYLRSRKVRGAGRRRLVAHFHTGGDYAVSVIAEHGNYLRSAASYLCSRHLGTHLMRDAVFSGPLLHYEKLYARYFDAFCDTALAGSAAQTGSYSTSLLVRLKHEVNVQRASLLALARLHR